jgi:hypothetical protein
MSAVFAIEQFALAEIATRYALQMPITAMNDTPHTMI